MNPLKFQQLPEGFFDSPDAVDFITAYDPYSELRLGALPHAYTGKIIQGAYAIVYVPREYVEESLSHFSPNYIDFFPYVFGLMGQEDLEASGIVQARLDPDLQLTGEGVLLGFVDTGIDYTNDAFRYADGSTKIQYIWDQTQPGNTPESFLIGTEYTQKQINRALNASNPYDLVPQQDTVGHGTFLASVAGSRETGEYMGAAPDAELIVVKLRKANPYHLERNMVPPEQENAFSSSDVMLGIEYILERAAGLGRPVSICLGLGSNSGGHDGFNRFEEYLTRTSIRTGVSLSVAAGNEVLTRHHAQGVLQYPGDTNAIGIKTEENARGINLQIWSGASDRLSVSIRSPAGELVARVPARAGSTLLTKLVLERSQISVQYFFPIPVSGSQFTWIKITDPTPGIWQITVHGDIVVKGTYHAWLPVTGFTDPGTEFLTPSPNYTITEPATAMGIITVGAYSTSSIGLYSNSSWGPTRLPALDPDLTAPGVGVNGTFPTGYGTMTGTSVAAAITAGAAALMLQWGIVERNNISLNTYLIQSYLIWGCTRDPGIVYPNEQWGYGKLNLMGALTQASS